MIAIVGRKRWPAQSFAQVSDAYLKAVQVFRDRGGTYPPRCEILSDDERTVIGHVSPQTGIVWPGPVLRLGVQPLYAPPGVHA